jgi:hypothetical protein
VKLYANNGFSTVLIGSATASGPSTSITTNGAVDILDGSRTITATQTQSGRSESASVQRSVVIDTPGPRVTNVIVSGSASPHTFSFNTVDGSGQQLATVPVGGADTISFVFGENVVGSSGDLVVRGLRTTTLPSLATTSPFTGSMTSTLAWRFQSWQTADHYWLGLSDSVIDVAGNLLDGEWTNPGKLYSSGTTYFTDSSISTFPSGNLQPGGDFNFVATILPGDATLNNIVNIGDFNIWNANNGDFNEDFIHGEFNGLDGVPGSTPRVTIADYDLLEANNGVNLQLVWLADVNSDGVVDNADKVIILANSGMTSADRDDGDVNGDTVVDGADYLFWQRQLGVQLRIVI